jgi:hypothetical protein
VVVPEVQMDSAPASDRVDFFVSYTHDDAAWAA